MTLERQYPVFSAEDDDFHDDALSDRWWETETCWFSWNVPERRMGGWTYAQVRPNARLCNGGVWVWDDRAAYSWELPYHANYWGLELPDERDLRDFEFPTGVRITCLEPLSNYRIRYADEGALELDLCFEAVMAPNPHPVGVAPFLKGTHFDQAGRVTGQMVLNGECIPVDCYALRDRSWGPRPQGRPRRRASAGAGVQTGAAGVGYCHGTASPDNAFLMYSIPTVADDPIVCGYLIRDGVYAHVTSGRRDVVVHPETGWVTHIEVDAIDDADRRLVAVGDAVSRHWRGHGGDTLMRWSWDGVEGWGEDQSYFSKAGWQSRRARAVASTGLDSVP